MNDFAFKCVALLIGSISLSSCSGEEARPPMATFLSDHRIDLAKEIGSRLMTGKVDHIRIDVGGGMSDKVEDELPKLSERPVPIYFVPPLPKPELTAAQKEYLASFVVVSAKGDAEFLDVVRRLRELSSARPVYVQNGGKHRAFEAYPDAVAVITGLGNTGEVNDFQMVIQVGHVPDADQCVYVFDGKPIGSVELSDKLYRSLEHFVDKNGGVEAVRSNQLLLERAVVEIQANQVTPWRCVMGADYHVRVAGWPFIRFAVMGE